MHDILADEDSPTSSKSDPDTDCDTPGESGHGGGIDDGDVVHHGRGSGIIQWGGAGERRRRKLPEIPKNKKRKLKYIFPK